MTEIFGLRFRDETLGQAADLIITDAKNDFKRAVFFVNAHCINVAIDNPTYMAVLHKQQFLYADGIGMALAARLWCNRLENNVNGTDLFPVLCQKAAKHSVPIALFGAGPGVARGCADRMMKMCPGLQVVWTGDGFISPEESDEVIEAINASGAKILLVARGVPLQELWIDENISKIDAPVILGVGALFDFYSGHKKRAPLFLRKAGMEWLFRLYTEPGRLFKRYVIGNPKFIFRAVRMRIFGTS